MVDHIKCPLRRYTFSMRPIREWVEKQCGELTLNLFAGKTLLSVPEIRNDVNPLMPADTHMDAVDLVTTNWPTADTVILDPPYSYRKAMEMYNGAKCSRFNYLKDMIAERLDKGVVITFGYHSISMGEKRGFTIERVGLFYHGGAIHDTIACVERKR